MANPLVIGGAALVGLWLLLKKPDAKAAPVAQSAPNVLPPPVPGSQTVQVPVSVPGVPAANQPTVTVTMPPAVVPTGVARFPDLPGATPTAAPTPVVLTPTPQQPVTYDLPNLVAQAAQAAQVLAPQVATVLAPPVAVQVEESKLDTTGTVELAGKMINAESSSGWKTALVPEITFWQSKNGLAQDGKFGVKGAAKMAELVGILPLIRYFPATSSTKAQALKSYRDMLYTMAANAEQKNPAQSLALQASAVYDTGQGWATNPPAIPATQRVAQANVLTATLKAGA